MKKRPKKAVVTVMGRNRDKMMFKFLRTRGGGLI